ncbi:MAG: FkbM family methyltransferase [Pirellulales bacterium]
MRRYLRPDSNCVDVGAHGGDLLRHMCRIAPRGRHHAFEPLPHLAEELRRNFPQASVHEAAVSDAAGTAEFQFVENAPGYSGLRRRQYDRPDPLIKVLQVKVTTLDDVMSNTALPGLIKIDVEGGEYHALLGAARTIKASKPWIIFEAGRRSTGEYGVTAEAIFDLLAEDHGYRVTTLRRHAHKNAPYDKQEFVANWHGGREFFFLAYSDTKPPSG